MKRSVTRCCLSILGSLLFVLAVSAQETPKVIRGGVLNGKALSLPHPEYPAEAKEAGLEGTVTVQVTIDEEGNVISAVASTEPRKIYKAGADPETVEELPVADPILRDAAERAALEAKFSPTRLSGNPVRVTGTITYNFKLQTDEQTGSYINGGVLNGKATSLPNAEYPSAALAVRASGAISVRVVIDEEGSVTSATAVSGHPLLRSAAVKAAREARFSPTQLNGQPVKISGIITYNFVLPEAENK